MQPLNHDMDELMRQAAASNPVKPQGMDWDKVAHALDREEGASASADRYGSLKKLGLFLPFFLGSFICDKFYVPQHEILKSKTAVEKSSPMQRSKSSAAQPIDVVKNSEENKNFYFNSTHQTANKKNVMVTQAGSSSMGILKSSVPTVTTLSTNVNHRFASAAGLKATRVPAISFQKQQTLSKKSISKHQDVTQKEKITKNSPQEKLWLNLLLGPDFSQVRSQKFDRTGYTVGLMFGYGFAKRWSLEAGVYWDHKNYFSRGDYFKTDKIYLPPHSNVMQVAGYCQMFELPLNIGYTVLQKQRSSLRALVGMSSYLMQNEDYDYVYRRYDVDYAGNTAYKRASKDWFSIANISLRYDLNIGAKNKILVESYMKLPVSGLGIGSLPLRSTGVFIGVTRVIR